MERSRLEEENIIKDVKNLFRFKKLKTETIDTTIKGVRNLENQKKTRKLEHQKTKIKQIKAEWLQILGIFLSKDI